MRKVGLLIFQLPADAGLADFQLQQLEILEPPDMLGKVDAILISDMETHRIDLLFEFEIGPGFTNSKMMDFAHQIESKYQLKLLSKYVQP